MNEWDGPASPELRAKLRGMFEASAALDQPSADDRQRVRTRLAAAIASSAPAPLSLPQQSAADGGSALQLGGGAQLGLGVLIKHSLLAMLLGASVTGAVLWVRGPAPRRPQHAVQAAPTPGTSAPVATRPSISPPSAAAPAAYKPEHTAPASSSTTFATDAPETERAASPQPTASEHDGARPRAPAAKKTRSTRPHTEPPTPTPPVPPPPAAAAARSAPLPPPSAAATPTADGASLSEELSLMMAAQHALAANQLARALLLLDQHARRFPSGTLVPERFAARAVALCRSRLPDQGARELQNLIARAPSSPLIAWVRSDCRSTVH